LRTRRRTFERPEKGISAPAARIAAAGLLFRGWSARGRDGGDGCEASRTGCAVPVEAEATQALLR